MRACGCCGRLRSCERGISAMRRKDREITDPGKIREIIAACDCCRLGFCDGGRAYIVPLDFGFVERYPAGKEAVTGIAHEPWHFRYVGVEAAEEIMGRGITLEEYLDSEE